VSNKEKKVTVKMDVRCAAAVRQVLFDSQKEYTNGPSAPERILNLRQVISDLDDEIHNALPSS